MRTYQYFTLALLTGMALIAALLTIPTQSIHGQTVGSAKTGDAPAPVDDAATVTLTLAITAAAPIVNQPVQITVTLTNHASSETVANPLYALWLESDEGAPLLVPDNPQVQHAGSIAPGASDVVSFDLYPVAGEQITVTADVSVSLQQTPQTTEGRQSQAIMLDVPNPDSEVAVIHEAVYELGCLDAPFMSMAIAYGADWAEFTCAPSPGHTVGSHLTRYESDALARRAFDELRGARPLASFHCHPAFEWSDRPPGSLITDSGHGWVATRWVTNSSAQDDTHLGTRPATVSEAVYRAIRARDLLGPCTDAYLPIVSR